MRQPPRTPPLGSTDPRAPGTWRSPRATAPAAACKAVRPARYNHSFIVLFFMVSSPFFLQVVNPMVGNLHFFFQDGHSVGKPIVVPDLTGHLLNFGIRDGLGNLQLLLYLFAAAPAGDDDADQGQAAGDQRYNDTLHMVSLVDGVRQIDPKRIGRPTSNLQPAVGWDTQPGWVRRRLFPGG